MRRESGSAEATGSLGGVLPRILILGGIGSGKSTASAWFAEQGAVVISSDDIARRILEPGADATRRVLDLWPGVGDDGVVDRARLGRIVFADPAELAALEAIVHPATRRALLAAVDRHSDRPVVVEMPILRDWLDDWVSVVVDAPDEIRLRRVLERGGMTRDDVRHVMARQPTRAEWLAAADFVLDNSRDIPALHRQCGVLWERLTGE